MEVIIGLISLFLLFVIYTIIHDHVRLTDEAKSRGTYMAKAFCSNCLRNHHIRMIKGERVHSFRLVTNAYGKTEECPNCGFRTFVKR